MIKDPLVDSDAYDVLAGVGVTPHSSMREVLDGSFELMAQGRMTPDARRAWDELRSPPRRLVVDLLRYPVDLAAEVAQAQAALAEALARWADVPLPPGPEAALAEQLAAIADDFREIAVRSVAVDLIPELDLPAPLVTDDFVRFDR